MSLFFPDSAKASLARYGFTRDKRNYRERTINNDSSHHVQKLSLQLNNNSFIAHCCSKVLQFVPFSTEYAIFEDNKMAISLRQQRWKRWCKLWRRRQKRLQFYQALSFFYERNNLKTLVKSSTKKQFLYKQRLNHMYNHKLKYLIKKIDFLKNKAIKFQLKYGVYDE
jgi:Lhr-like helicase